MKNICVKINPIIKNGEDIIMNSYPLKLKSVLKDYLWAGTRISSEFGKSENPNEKIAESWELAVHKNGVNIIENGEYAGKTLEDLFNLDKSIISPDYKSDRFPVLIKYIDAGQDLSVQVHPDDDYAYRVENESGKTEVWYIIDAKPDSELIYGLNDDYTREQLQNLINENRFGECLNYVKVKPGEVYFIPAGLVHAIGEGILIAEIQQNSDTTYRFYDYNRLGADGKLRELHIEKALDVCIKTKSSTKNIKSKTSCEYFDVKKITGVDFILDSIKSFVSVVCIDGKGGIICGEKTYEIKKGDSYFIPAGIKNCEIKKINKDFTFLLTTLGNA